MLVFKVEAEGDTIYVKGDTKEEALLVFRKHMGDWIPENAMTWKGPMKLPKGQQAFE